MLAVAGLGQFERSNHLLVAPFASCFTSFREQVLHLKTEYVFLICIRSPK